MRIAVDYDNTYTLDPEGWRQTIALWRRLGWDVRGVTARSSTEDRTLPLLDFERNFEKPVIYTNGIAKRAACMLLGWEPDTWLDDKPHNILHDSTTTPEQLALWRATRGEGPLFPIEPRLLYV